MLLTCAGRASFIRGLEYRPNIETLRKHHETYSGPALQEWVAREYAASVAVNQSVLFRKARWAGGAVAALYAEGLFLAAAGLVILLL